MPTSNPDPDELWTPVATALGSLFGPLTSEEERIAESRPSLPPAQYMEAAAAVMQFCLASFPDRATSHPDAGNHRDKEGSREVYERIENYLNTTCQRIGEQLVATDAKFKLLTDHVLLYDHFIAGVRILVNVAAHITRHWLRRQEDEGWAWYQATQANLAHQYGVSLDEWLEPFLRDQFELGTDDAKGSHAWKQAMGRAEAAADPAAFPISILGTGKRAWRIHLIEPMQEHFLAVLRDHADAELSRETLVRFGDSLKDVGLKRDHPLRLAVSNATSKQ